MTPWGRVVLTLILCAASFASYAKPQAFTPDRAKFSASVEGLTVPYRDFALFAMPGEKVTVSVSESGESFHLSADAGKISSSHRDGWKWKAPKRPGHYLLNIVRSDGARIRLQAFVMVPATEVRHGELNGYRIGKYPSIEHARHAKEYAAPKGFVQVTPALEKIHVSPHFTLGQFVCKEAGGFPKYIVLKRRLLLKLEILMDYLNSHGVDASHIHVMSGYRTPWYNSRLGDVADSQHTLGEAADIYIDVAPKNGIMDDLNHDGHDNFKDSKLLASDVNRLFREPQYAFLRGGVGAYHSTATHGPFVHVDARGWRARWSGR